MSTIISTSDAPAETVLINRCSSCGDAISLQAPTPDSPAIPWLCVRCGSVYFARPQEKGGRSIVKGTRVVSYGEVIGAIQAHLKDKASPIDRDQAQRLVQCLSARKFEGPENRRQKRYPVVAPVTVIPLGHDFRIAGQPIRATTLNVSGGGTALLQQKPNTAPYLAIDFAASGVDLLPAVLQVTRSRKLGPAFEAAGKFLSRILQS